MNWPKFDFSERAHVQRKRWSDGAREMNLKKDYSKTRRSLAADFQTSRSKKRKSVTKQSIVQNRNSINLHQEMLPDYGTSACSQKDPFQMVKEVNPERIPPLSPILVNGFLRKPLTSSSMHMKESNSNTEVAVKVQKRMDTVNPFSFNVLQCESAITIESSRAIPSRSKHLFVPDSNAVLRKSEIISEGETLADYREISTSSASFTKKSENVINYSNSSNLECDQNEEGGSNDLELLTSSSSSSIHSPSSSSTLLETLPPPETDSKDLYGSGSFSEVSEHSLDSQPEIVGSEKSIAVGRTESDSDISQNLSGCLDSESVGTDEQSRDSFLDVTIHETESNDHPCEAEPFVQSIPSSVVNQSEIDDCREDVSKEVIYQRQHHRLSKLAEALKKRMFIGSSDLAMWKCEEPKQQPERQVTVVSRTEQWGIFWTTVKSVVDSRTAQIMDCQPMKKITDVVSTSYKNQGMRNVDKDEEEGCSSDREPLQQISQEETFLLHQPLSKLNIPLGEVILAPRYYR